MSIPGAGDCIFDETPGFPKNSDFEISGQHFGPGTFWDQCWVQKNMILLRNVFVIGFQGISLDPNEFYCT